MFEGIELFSSLSSDMLTTLEMFCQEREFESGENLFNQGDEATAMYILKTGKLEVYDFEKVLGEVLPGEIVGEMGILSANKTRMASVRAIEKSKLITILAFSLNDLGNKYPEILNEIKNIIENRKKMNSKK